MPALRPLPPENVRKLLENQGWRLIKEDKYNWFFVQRDDDAPVIVPHTVGLIPLELVFALVKVHGLDGYFEELEKAPLWPDDWQS